MMLLYFAADIGHWTAADQILLSGEADGLPDVILVLITRAPLLTLTRDYRERRESTGCSLCYCGVRGSHL